MRTYMVIWYCNKGEKSRMLKSNKKMFEINKKCSKLTFFCEKLTFFRTRVTRSKQAPIHSPYKWIRGDAVRSKATARGYPYRGRRKQSAKGKEKWKKKS